MAIFYRTTIHERLNMTCLCKEMAGNGSELSPTCIGSLWIFEKLDSDDVVAIVRKALRKKMTKGQTIFMQGGSADEVFLIKGGRIKLTKVLEDGTELMLDIRKAGEFVGENMFSEEGPYPVSAICLKDIGGSALIDDKTKQMLYFWEIVTRNAYKVHAGTMQVLRDHGCSDEEIFEAVAVASLFNLMDRMADALGAPVEGLQEMMKQMSAAES